VTAALLWLWFVEKQRPDRWDIVGAAVSLVGMAIGIVVAECSCGMATHLTSTLYSINQLIT
jgi:drug/metabolite transporter superfamily protein YnfA